MRNKLMLTIVTILIIHISTSSILCAEPKIINITTNYPISNNWIRLPHKGTLQIKVKASQIEKVIFWLVPAGTATWNDRTLIGQDENESNEFSIDWPFSNQQLYHHIVIQAFGQNKSIQTETLNITQI